MGTVCTSTYDVNSINDQSQEFSMADKPKKAGGDTQDVSVVPRGRSVLPGIEREFERFFNNRWPRLFDWAESFNVPGVKSPNVDVLDRENDVCVRAELPGFAKKDIEVSVSGGSVTIKASTESEEKEEKGDFFRQEISRGFVSRTVSLPAEVDGEKATARLNDGVLEVVIPKVAKAKRQKVEIAG
jgi:HSP20 family protein